MPSPPTSSSRPLACLEHHPTRRLPVQAGLPHTWTPARGRAHAPDRATRSRLCHTGARRRAPHPRSCRTAAHVVAAPACSPRSRSCRPAAHHIARAPPRWRLRRPAAHLVARAACRSRSCSGSAAPASPGVLRVRPCSSPRRTHSHGVVPRGRALGGVLPCSRLCHAAAHRSPRTRVHSATRPRPRPRSRLCHAAAHLVGAQLAGGRAACRRTSPPRTASLAVAPLSRAHVAEDITRGRSARPRAQRPPTCRSTHCEPRHGRACRTARLRGGSRVRTQAGPRDCIVERGAARFGCERDDHVVLTPANVSLCRLPLYVLV
jgi:hypothetical protein